MVTIIVENKRLEISSQEELLKTLIIDSHPGANNEENTFIKGVNVINKSHVKNDLINTLSTCKYININKDVISITPKGVELFNEILELDILNAYDVYRHIIFLSRGYQSELQYKDNNETDCKGVYPLLVLLENKVSFNIDGKNIRIVETDSECVRNLVIDGFIEHWAFNKYRIKRVKNNKKNNNHIQKKYKGKRVGIYIDERTHAYLKWCKEYMNGNKGNLGDVMTLMTSKVSIPDMDVERYERKTLINIREEYITQFEVEVKNVYEKLLPLVLTFVNSLPEDMRDKLEKDTGFSIND